MKMDKQKIKPIALDLHCDRLGRFVLDHMGWVYPPDPRPKEEEYLSSLSVFDWLRVAASIESVFVNTLPFAEGVMYCSGAAEYEDKRSDLLSEVLKDQLRFTFVWGAFETLAKIIDPPIVPKNVKARCSIVDRVAYLLKNAFDQSNFIPWGYNYWLGELKIALGSSDTFYVKKHFTLTACAGHSGLAISIIRRIRNQFAHGIVNLPEPEKYTGKKPTEPVIVKLSTRLVLLTMQMMLLAKYQTPRWNDENIPDFDEISLDDFDWSALAVLHLQPFETSDLPLFRALDEEA